MHLRVLIWWAKKKRSGKRGQLKKVERRERLNSQIIKRSAKLGRTRCTDTRLMTSAEDLFEILEDRTTINYISQVCGE